MALLGKQANGGRKDGCGLAEIKGKKVVCDVCGRSEVFLEFKQNHYDMCSGGFGSYDEYEPRPDGWERVTEYGVYDSCPSCSKMIAEAETKYNAEIEKLEKEKVDEIKRVMKRIRKGGVEGENA